MIINEKYQTIDFHTHIFPPEIRKNREKYFNGEPGFRILYSSPKAKMAGVSEIINQMDEQQVDISVVFGFPWKNNELNKRHNDYVFEAAEKYPKRLKSFCCFDVNSKHVFKEVERYVTAGVSGIGEIAFYDTGWDETVIEKMKPIMEIAKKKNIPVLIHTNEPVGHSYPGKTVNTLNEIYRFIKNFPENIIVLAHWGGGIFFYNLLKKEVKETLKNVYIDTAASPYLYDPEIYKVAAKLTGPEKILFGSDYPLIKPSRYFSEIKKAGLSKEETKKILGLNAVEIFNKKN